MTVGLSGSDYSHFALWLMTIGLPSWSDCGFCDRKLLDTAPLYRGLCGQLNMTVEIMNDMTSKWYGILAPSLINLYWTVLGFILVCVLSTTHDEIVLDLTVTEIMQLCTWSFRSQLGLDETHSPVSVGSQVTKVTIAYAIAWLSIWYHGFPLHIP